jgi:hypothetical protein
MQEIIETFDYLGTRDSEALFPSCDLQFPRHGTDENTQLADARKGGWFITPRHPGEVGWIVGTPASAGWESHVPFQNWVIVVVGGRPQERVDERVCLDDVQRHRIKSRSIVWPSRKRPNEAVFTAHCPSAGSKPVLTQS